MAILKPADCDVAIDGDRVRIQLAGKTHFIDPVGAMYVGKAIANAGADIVPTTEGLHRVENIMLRPIGADGEALLAITLEGFGGPVSVVVSHHWLTALASAAEAALEFADTAGSA
jgi:hypothetical protein